MSENFSEENKVTEFDDTEEIEFDDSIDIDALQNQLKEHMAASDIDYNPEPVQTENVEEEKSNEEVFQEDTLFAGFSEDGNTGSEQNEKNNTLDINNFMNSVEVDDAPAAAESEKNQSGVKEPEEKLKLQLGEKKYVIYVEPENVKFIDKLSIKERKKLINRILKQEDSSIRRKKELADRAKFINQVILMVITVVVSLPIFFILLNKSLEVTILNYQQSQQNFVKLYKEQGKIKSYKKFQNKF